MASFMAFLISVPAVVLLCFDLGINDILYKLAFASVSSASLSALLASMTLLSSSIALFSSIFSYEAFASSMAFVTAASAAGLSSIPALSSTA